MKKNNVKKQYPLEERIGIPELLVGREKEFALFDKWISGIPKKFSRSKAILARKKGGKTALVQLLFNRIWQENGNVIPFYMEIPDKKQWYPDFSFRYYQTFASQYISFLERKPDLMQGLMPMEKIREYGEQHSISLFTQDIDEMYLNKDKQLHDSIWERAITAPHRFASVYDKFILVILDEFQNLGRYVCIDQDLERPHETLPGGYHEHSESKIAPMLVTGSDVGWLIQVIDKYLEGGRLQKTRISPYLTKEEGLDAVYKYAEVFDVRINNESAIHINDLCLSDPFFISCVVRSEY